jgi:hypothetical protein
MYSYPTPAEAANVEWMNGNFLKLHPGAPVHYFKDCRDEHYHTHPFAFTTHIIEGGYREEILVAAPDGTWVVNTLERRPGTSHEMPLGLPHKLIGLLDGPCITRCEYGPALQKPGFCRLDEWGYMLHRYWDEPAGEWHSWPRT